MPIWIFLAAIGPAIFIIAASYAECNRTVVVVMFVSYKLLLSIIQESINEMAEYFQIFSMGFMGTFYPGMKVNPLDLSPNYAGKFLHSSVFCLLYSRY